MVRPIVASFPKLAVLVFLMLGFMVEAQAQTVQEEPLPPPPAAPDQPLRPKPHTIENGQRGARVALLVPLSGPNAALGQILSNAAQLALFDVADPLFELQPIDTKGTPQGAQDAMASAIEQGADVVLGPLFSGEVKAIATAAFDHRLPVLAFTTDKNVVGNGVYTLGLLPETQVARLFEAVKADGRTRVAVVAPDSDFGHAMADAASAKAQAFGLDLTKVQFYSPNTADFRTIAQSVANYSARKAQLAQEKNLLSGRGGKLDPNAPSPKMPFEALLIAEEGVRLKSLVSLLTYYGLDPGPVRFLGTLRWEDKSVAEEPVLQGAWYAAPPQAGLEAFEAHYAKVFGTLPKSAVMLASGAYDGLALVAVLAKKYQSDPLEARFSPDRLADAEGFLGVGGLFRLRPNGINERGLTVREIAKTGNTEAQPAPDKFPPMAP